jgi:hypothetical protein
MQPLQNQLLYVSTVNSQFMQGAQDFNDQSTFILQDTNKIIKEKRQSIC